MDSYRIDYVIMGDGGGESTASITLSETALGLLPQAGDRISLLRPNRLSPDVYQVVRRSLIHTGNALRIEVLVRKPSLLG